MSNFICVRTDVFLANRVRFERFLTVRTQEGTRIAVARLVTVESAPGREQPLALRTLKPGRIGTALLVRPMVSSQHPL